MDDPAAMVPGNLKKMPVEIARQSSPSIIGMNPGKVDISLIRKSL